VAERAVGGRAAEAGVTVGAAVLEGLAGVVAS
jgi:hypothetical protein